MRLPKISVLCAFLVLSACNSSNDAPLQSGSTTAGPTDNTTGPTDNTTTPGNNDSGVGSITISTAQAPILESLPDITYNPATNTSDGRPVSAAMDDAAGGDGSVSPESGDGGGTDAGSTGDASFGDAGSTGDDSFDGGGTAGAGIAAPLTDAESEVAGDVARPPDTIIVYPVEPKPNFQAGTLTAADYDDQLNPHLYQSYASDYLQRVGGRLDVPYLDLSNRIGLHVTDEQGRRYGGALIEVSDANGEIVSVKTPANGVSYIYTDTDQLPEQFTIRVTGIYGTAIEKDISLSQVVSGRIDVVLPENIAPAAGTQQAAGLDLMFVVDTTGSMGDELDYLQTELASIINAIPSNTIATNIGLTFYRDNGDEYVVRAHDFNQDINSVQNTLNNENHNGGGDYPEAMDQALHQALDANWQQDSHKVLFLIADAPPHDNKMRATWEAAERARAKNIHIVPVAASGVGEDAEYIMRSMAAFTNSRYVFLTDDSGFGNAHAEPDVDCYAVTQLNNLMIRVLNSLISGVRQEPTDNDIIRTVGNYNAGVCDPVFIIQ